MSILFVINSCTAPILFLKEFTFRAPIVTFLAFCNLCTVTDGKTSFLAELFSSAELFVLNDLLVSTVGLTGLSVLELFTLTTKFLYILFCYCRFFFFCFVSCVHAGFIPSRIHTRAKVVNKTCGTIFIQMNSTFAKHAQTNVIVISKGQLPNSAFVL